MKKYFFTTILFVGLLMCVTGCGEAAMLTAEASEIEEADPGPTEKDSAIEKPGTIYVQISGFIRHPGVYEVPDGTRLYQLVDMAGGFLEDAAADDINQVEVLKDGQHVKILNKEDFLLEQEAASEAEAGLVDLNKASESDLCTLPGIGPGKAAGIIKYREENGGFSAKEDLMNVSGIGESTYKKLEDHITVK